MSGVIELSIPELEASIARQQRGISLAEEAAEMKGSLRAFVKRAWPAVWPNEQYVHGWHIDAICDHLEAASAGELRRLQIWVPPGTSKSTLVSIMWPVWEWLARPHLRYITASYDLELAKQFAQKSRDLIRSPWFTTLWPELHLKRDQDTKHSYANIRGGSRLATSPSGTGTGRHAHRIVIDDALNAREIASDAKLAEVADWHDGTISMRHIPGGQTTEVIIQQRLAERDLAGHLLAGGASDWYVLCLPEAYERKHPFVCPREVTLPSGRVMRGDPRSDDGQLMWPELIGEAEHARRLAELREFRAAGQLQQRPAAREGAILKRAWWRFYPPQMRDESDAAFVGRLPKFSAIWQSWDTSLKDSSQSDRVAGTVWGQKGADLYLLPESRHANLGLSATKAAIRQVSAWVDERWPGLPQRILIEKTANGPEVIAELKRELRGIIATTPSVGADKPAVKKTIRAEAAEPALEGGNIYVPGRAMPEALEGYDSALTPAISQELIEQCAVFPLGDHDDLVDSFTQVVNWSRSRRSSGSISVAQGRVPEAGALAGADSWDRF